MIMVSSASKMHEAGLCTMSTETMGSSQYSRMPSRGPCRGGREGGVDFFGRGHAVDLGHEVGEGAVGDGHADGHAVQPAVEFRDHLADGLGRAGARGDHGQGRRTGAPGVTCGRSR